MTFGEISPFATVARPRAHNNHAAPEIEESLILNECRRKSKNERGTRATWVLFRDFIPLVGLLHGRKHLWVVRHSRVRIIIALRVALTVHSERLTAIRENRKDRTLADRREGGKFTNVDYR